MSGRKHFGEMRNTTWGHNVHATHWRTNTQYPSRVQLRKYPTLPIQLCIDARVDEENQIMTLGLIVGGSAHASWVMLIRIARQNYPSEWSLHELHLGIPKLKTAKKTHNRPHLLVTAEKVVLWSVCTVPIPWGLVKPCPHGQ